MADNWFADHLIRKVGLGARAVSRKTPIYFIISFLYLSILKLQCLYLALNIQTASEKATYAHETEAYDHRPTVEKI